MNAAIAQALDLKRLATLKAELALKGFSVHEVSTGGYFVARWNLTKFCPAQADLEAFAAQAPEPFGGNE